LGNLFVVIPLAVVAGVLQATIFEWIYHRYWLHRPWLPPQMFTAHTLVHHSSASTRIRLKSTSRSRRKRQRPMVGRPALVAIKLIPWSLVARLAQGTACIRLDVVGVVGGRSSPIRAYEASTT
jgi:hypothetical protein